MSSLRERESAEQRQARLDLNADSTAFQRLFESTEHRQTRLEKMPIGWHLSDHRKPRNSVYYV